MPHDEPDRSDDTPVLITVLHEDAWFLVVNKPVHLLTQAPEGIPSLQAQLLVQHAREGAPKPFIGIPHRLDRMTSGAVVIARNQRALRRLCDQFAARTIEKVYLAWVHGTPKPSDTFVDSMRKVENEPRAEIVDSSEEGSRTASLSYRDRASRSSKFSLGQAPCIRFGCSSPAEGIRFSAIACMEAT
jgi:23S rRNA pseudouridine1911/1915/1917 synthase